MTLSEKANRMDLMNYEESIARTLEGILETEKDIGFAYLFGSAAEGEMGAASDVDVAVMFDADPAMSRELALHHRIAKAMKRDVDLVTLNRVRSMPLLASILKQGIVVRDRDPEGRFDFELDTHHRYLDFRSMKDYCRERPDS